MHDYPLDIFLKVRSVVPPSKPNSRDQALQSSCSLLLFRFSLDLLVPKGRTGHEIRTRTARRTGTRRDGGERLVVVPPRLTAALCDCLGFNTRRTSKEKADCKQSTSSYELCLSVDRMQTGFPWGGGGEGGGSRAPPESPTGSLFAV